MSSNTIEIALWNIEGKAFEASVFKLLGEPLPNKANCYSHVQGIGVPSLLNNALEAVDRGWKFASSS